MTICSLGLSACTRAEFFIELFPKVFFQFECRQSGEVGILSAPADWFAEHALLPSQSQGCYKLIKESCTSPVLWCPGEQHNQTTGIHPIDAGMHLHKVSAQGYTKAILNEGRRFGVCSVLNFAGAFTDEPGAFVDLPLGADGQLVRHYRPGCAARCSSLPSKATE